MKIYLAGTCMFPFLYDESERDRITKKAPEVWANSQTPNELLSEFKPYILESFFYSRKGTAIPKGQYGDILIDSGAYTFCHNQRFNAASFENYLEEYAAFINRHGFDKYFELDIDSIVGYERVKDYRKELEALTHKQTIPVWHPSRGTEEFIRLCEEYPYVSLGGFAGADKKTRMKYKAAYPWFIKTAHEHNAKIHGLGYTSISGLKVAHFDSVDSSSWNSGARFGSLPGFNGREVTPYKKPNNSRLTRDWEVTTLVGFTEWVKYQRYADKNL